MTFKIIETFSGIGAQAKAFKNIQKKNPEFNYKVLTTVEWEIGAMYAYDLIHHGPQDLSLYEKSSKENLISFLEQYNLSADGKQPLKKGALKRMSIEKLKAIRHSIENTNNLVDISTVHSQSLPEADLLTYSFPCQDLSISSYWHKNFSGIAKGIENRSGLLWEIERILKEYKKYDQKLPRFLLMENVSAIQGPLHLANFEMWKKELERLGYLNITYDLNASNFGIPQNRTRTFMISIFKNDLTPLQIGKINEFFKLINLERLTDNPTIDNFLRLDYSNSQYFKEALMSTPNDTPSRRKIGAKSVRLADGQIPRNNIAKTITTKQDRFPNAGIVIHKQDFGSKKMDYRNLTPRETFLLMGFDESDFQRLLDYNLSISSSRKMLSNAKLLKLSGNSIVVNVLEEIFYALITVNDSILQNNFDYLQYKQAPHKLVRYS